jgi:GDP-L-fucose synthase
VGGLFMNQNNNIDMFSKNIKINENILEACKKYNINKGIFCLSSCIFPSNPKKFPMNDSMIHESPPHHSNEGYAYSKRMLEFQCRQYNLKYNTKFICVVPVNLYGPNDNFNLNNGHVIASLMNRFYKESKRENQNYYVYGDGSPERQFLYAPDFAKIICELLLKNIYNDNHPVICCNDEITIKEMVNILCNVMKIDNKLLEWGSELDNGCIKKTVDNSKILKIMPSFKFTPLTDGLNQMFHWYCKNINNIRE